MPYIKREVAGQIVSIEVSEQTGQFTYTNGVTYESVWDDSLPKLIDKVRRLLAKRRTTVNIPVGILSGGEPMNVRLTQLSARERGYVLTKDQDGKAADSVRGSDAMYAPWTEASAAEYRQLRAAYTAASDALDKFKRAHFYGGATETYKVRAEDIVEAAVTAKAAQLEAKAQAAVPTPSEVTHCEKCGVIYTAGQAHSCRQEAGRKAYEARERSEL